MSPATIVGRTTTGETDGFLRITWNERRLHRFGATTVGPHVGEISSQITQSITSA